MAEHRHQGLPVALRIFGLMQSGQCVLPACCCPHGLLFVWQEPHRGPVPQWRVAWELQTRDGRRLPGGAKTEDEAVRFADATLRELGFQRMRVIHGRPVEVPRA